MLFLGNCQELIGQIEGATFTRDLLASTEIESMEIVKGAAAVQYGSDAIGGVINIAPAEGPPRPESCSSANTADSTR